MATITIIKETKDYVVLRVPKKLMVPGIEEKRIAERKLLALSREAVKLYRRGKLPLLHSLRDLR
ncbi:MAG: hypothetical protein Q8R35_00015 [bacterium]|nr:hypothetical protein [bacterium]